MRLILFLLCSCFLVHAADSPTTFGSREVRYRLQPSDVLDIQYRYTPQFNQTVSVQPDGFVTLQMGGDLKLGGLTLSEAQAAIVRAAGERLKDPEIAISLKDFQKPYFVVGGEVEKPGRFEMRGTVTALEAIQIAGGLKSMSAKHSQVILFRGHDSTTAETRVINLKQLLEHPDTREDVDLRPGDMLVVPQNRVSKIERYIKWANVGMYVNPMGF
jgi:polysaccharide biosynthesis/export protein